LKTQDINKVTVTNLSEMADMNRGTFYIHYDDVYDLLESIEDRLLAEITEIVSTEVIQGEIIIFEEEFMNIVNALKYIDSNREIFKVLLNDRGSLLFLNRMKKMFSEKLLNRLLSVSVSNANYNNILTSFYITGFIGAIQEWLKSDSNISVLELATLIKTQLNNGFEAVE
jgi:hypothetical protein